MIRKQLFFLENCRDKNYSNKLGMFLLGLSNFLHCVLKSLNTHFALTIIM